jgi:hypothetical protein
MKAVFVGMCDGRLCLVLVTLVSAKTYRIWQS